MNWDRYFRNICETVASKSPCMSRKIGAILVRDNCIVSTGYNGPPRGVPHCGVERNAFLKYVDTPPHVCPRVSWGYKSGQGLEHCPAVHAEMNAVIAAARSGASTLGTTLYMNCIIPCKQCMGILINAGIREIVIDSLIDYDELTSLLHGSKDYPSVRTFNFNGGSNG